MIWRFSTKKFHYRKEDIKEIQYHLSTRSITPKIRTPVFRVVSKVIIYFSGFHNNVVVKNRNEKGKI